MGFGGLSYLALGILKERSRRSKLSFKERFLEDFRKSSGFPFPLSEFEKARPELVGKTRRALYGAGGFGEKEYESFLTEWNYVLKSER